VKKKERKDRLTARIKKMHRINFDVINAAEVTCGRAI